MSAAPWILAGGGAAALGTYLWMRREHESNKPLPGRWMWPLGMWRNRKPEISSGFESERRSAKGERVPHNGVDLMYRRIESDKCPPGTPNGSRGFIMPDHRAALAAADGVASFAHNTPRGWSVIVDHVPSKISTYYTHLSQLLVVPQQVVLAGQPIGIIGSDPLDAEHLMHLHFELWRGGRKGAIDPERLMRAWEYVPDPGDLPQALARNGSPFSASQSCSPHPGGGGALVRASYRVPPFLADDVLLVTSNQSNSNGRVYCVAWDTTWGERHPERSGWLDRDTLTPIIEQGMRVELSSLCPLWGLGAKYGTVREVTKDWTVVLKMDNPEVRRLQRFTDHTALKIIE